MSDQEDDLSMPLSSSEKIQIERRKQFSSGSDRSSAQPSTEAIDKVVEQQIAIQNESWIKSYWRPTMAWLYMAICFMDFIGFPFLAGVQPIVYKIVGIAVKYEPWVSLTLQNGGLVHAAFGAILGVAAWTRGVEKLNR